MASIRIRREWPDGETLDVIVYADNTYPEAIAVARENALTALEDASELIVPTDITSDDTDGVG